MKEQELDIDIRTILNKYSFEDPRYSKGWDSKKKILLKSSQDIAAIPVKR